MLEQLTDAAALVKSGTDDVIALAHRERLIDDAVEHGGRDVRTPSMSPRMKSLGAIAIPPILTGASRSVMSKRQRAVSGEW